MAYSRDDEPLIAPVVDLLRLTDTEVFRDRDSIPPGDKWRPAVQDAIQQATECLVFWCAHSATSDEVGREVELALELGKRMIPVLLDDSPLGEVLCEFQAIDMRSFRPHTPTDEPPEASKEEKSGNGLKHVPNASPQFRKEALEYLKKELEELLRVERLRLIP